jgi:diguanylate cyclase (GGDEF)-like protein
MRGEASPQHRLPARVAELRQRVAELETLHRQSLEDLRQIEARNRLLGDSAPFGMFTTDADGRVTGINRRMREMMLWPDDSENGAVSVFKHPMFVAWGLADHLRRCLTERRTILSTTSNACKMAPEGCRNLRYHFSPVINDAAVLLGVMAFVEDLTDLKQAEEAVRDSEERYRILFETAPIALVERDAAELSQYLAQLSAGGVVDFEAYLDAHPEEVDHCLQKIETVRYNRAFLDLVEARSIKEFNAGLAAANPETFLQIARDIIMMVVDGDPARDREQTFTTLNGNRRSVLIKSLAVSSHEDPRARFVISVVDITKRKAAEEALRASEQKFREQALRDNLTGLYNRRYLYQSLSELLDRRRIDGKRLSIIFMDLDHFKRVVDTHGHLNGSKAIRLVAGAIRECLVPPAFAVAYAGDEFVVVLPEADPTAAAAKAAQISETLKTTEFDLGDGVRVRIEASFGVATFPDHADGVDDLLATADQALFSTKKNGKGRVSLYQRAASG